MCCFYTDSHHAQCYLKFSWVWALVICVNNFFHFALKRYFIWKTVRYFWRTLYKTWKVKVKLTLCLTKHRAMETYWRSRGIAPRILDLSTRWEWMVSFTPRPLYSHGKSPSYPFRNDIWESLFETLYMEEYHSSSPLSISLFIGRFVWQLVVLSSRQYYIDNALT